MIYESDFIEEKAALSTAMRMCAAARTAPKAHGKDTIHTTILTGDDKDGFADEMEKLGTKLMGDKMCTWYGRDANNIRKSKALVLVGADRKTRNVPNCGNCGFKNCAECVEKGGCCSFALIDLGIAVSSAVNVAAQDMVDTRIMYSAGKTAEALEGYENIVWLGIPVSVSGKNIFFDRGITHD